MRIKPFIKFHSISEGKIDNFLFYHKITKFTKDDMNAIHDHFQDIAIEYNIEDNTQTGYIEENEVKNQYFIGLAANAYIEINLFAKK